MAYSPQQIVDMVNHGKGPNGMYSGSDQSGRLSKLHQEIAADMLQLQGAMKEHWQGDASGQAYAGAGPLVQASNVSGDHLTQAQGLYTGQGSSFKDLQGKVAAVGNLGDKPKDDWVSDTPLSFLSNRSNDINAWNQKAQQVVDGYYTYHGQSTDNSGRWTAPSQYGELGLPPGGADIKPVSPESGPGSQQSVSGFGSGQPGTSQHGGTASGYGGPGHSGGPVGGGGPQQGGQSGNYVPPPGTASPGSPGHGGPSPSDTTTTAGYLPPAATGNGGDYNTGGYGNTGFGPGGSGTGGFGPGSGSAGGFMPGGGFGPGGSGAGSGAGAGGIGAGKGSGAGAGGIGAGKGSGAGAMGGEPGAGSRVSGGAAGGAGRPGGAGMGAGGGMGRGGKGEEDTEHKTADYLLEHDPDDALIGELPKATPPVIGLRDTP